MAKLGNDVRYDEISLNLKFPNVSCFSPQKHKEHKEKIIVFCGFVVSSRLLVFQH